MVAYSQNGNSVGGSVFYNFLTAVAAVIAAAAIIAGIWFMTRPKAEEEYVDSEVIDEIFRQATDLVEESGLNP